MAGSFRRIKQKMQDFFLGEETDKQSNQDVAVRRQKMTTHHRQPTQIHKDAETSAKVTHHYPKKGNFRFPLRVEDPGIQNSPEEEPLSDFPATGDTRAEEDTKGRQVVHHENETGASDNSADKRHYFQGNDFSSADIPSPVFGFERVPLHPDYLKKMNQTVLPVDPQDQHQDQEVDIDSMEDEIEEKEITDVTEEIAHVDEHEVTYESWKEIAANTVETPPETKEIVQEKQTELVEAETINNSTETEPPRLSRQERRRQKRESQEMTSEKRNSSNNNLPFNVFMYADGQKSSAKKDKSEINQDKYQFPGIHLLSVPPKTEENDSEALQQQKQQLENTLHNFNVNAKVIDVTKGPSVTRYEVQPAAGVKVNKITNLSDDMKLALAAKDLRMEAPIPGKNAIGIEVPNPQSKPVFLREILRRDVFTRSESPLTVAMGLDISGSPIVADLQKMPHGLIAGATGSGKSVCINSILLSLLYKSNPEEVKLMLIDPKMVELASYKEIPHLVTPVINDAKEATAGLKWAVAEMEERYERLAYEGVRDITKYNERMLQNGKINKKMPYIVIIIDELADLMMVSPQDVEDAVCRIAQKARACGIHLLLATQRPSVDVITGLIKANIPSRTAFAVSSQVDSRTILDMGGAERLIGKGDMLFHENSSPKPIRVQGTFVSDEEIDTVTAFVRKQKGPAYMFEREELAKKVDRQESGDDLFPDVCHFVSEQGSASSSLLQRHFSIGYNRAAKLIDMMEKKGIISGARGSKPRQVLMSQTEIEEHILD